MLGWGGAVRDRRKQTFGVRSTMWNKFIKTLCLVLLAARHHRDQRESAGSFLVHFESDFWYIHGPKAGHGSERETVYFGWATLEVPTWWLIGFRSSKIYFLQLFALEASIELIFPFNCNHKSLDWGEPMKISIKILLKPTVDNRPFNFFFPIFFIVARLKYD